MSSEKPKPTYEELESKNEARREIIRGLLLERSEDKEYCKVQEVNIHIRDSEMRDERGRFLPGRYVEELIGQLPTHYLITPTTEKGGDIIWKYNESGNEKGIFKPNGNNWVETQVFSVCGEKVSTGIISSIVKLTQVATYDFDNIFVEQPGFITLKNGVYDIEKRELREFSPDFFSKNVLPVFFDSEAKCPKILKFIKEIVPDDVDLIQEWFGYHLLKNQKFQKAFIFVGVGANGKSTLVDLCAKWLGEENVSNVSMYELTSDRFAAADLYGKLANHAPDLSSDEIKRTGRFKAMTGQDKVRAQKKMQNAFSFYSYAIQTFMTNQVPTSPDQSVAFFRRWKIVEFLKSFEGDKADPDLLSKLTTEKELSGLFNWALEGLYRLLDNGKFSKEMSVEATRAKYEFLADPVTAFIEHCITDEYEEEIPKKRLHAFYKAYCKYKGKVPLYFTKFCAEIGNRLLHIADTRPTIDGKRVSCWGGIMVLCGSKDTCQGCQGSQGILYQTLPNILQAKIQSIDNVDSLDSPQTKSTKIPLPKGFDPHKKVDLKTQTPNLALELKRILVSLREAQKITGGDVNKEDFIKFQRAEGNENIERLIDVLLRDGTIYSPHPGTLKTVEGSP